jgi:hypothetical protein
MVGIRKKLVTQARVVACGLLLTSLVACASTEGQGLTGTGSDTLQVEVAKVIPEGGSDFARFGHSVAVDGDIVVVGAWGEDDFGDESGAAYVFERSTSGWRVAAVLTASDARAGTRFGYSVAVQSSTVVVGALYESSHGLDSGAVYVFDRGESGWTESAKLTPEAAAENSHFGKSLSLSGDRLAIGAPGPGSTSAYVFRREEGGWLQEARIASAGIPSSARFGSSLALSGDTLAVGAWADTAEQLGSVSVYQRVGASWTETQRITGGEPNDRFGFSVALEDSYLAVGAPDAPGKKVLLYRRSDDGWVEAQVDIPEGSWLQLGHSVALGAGNVLAGDPAFDGAAEHEGRVLMLGVEAGGRSSSLLPMPFDSSADKSFGIAVAATEGVIVIGATGDEEQGIAAGAAYIFYDVEGEP